MATLRPNEDAFGQMLFALYRGSEVFEIVERDDGYIEAMSAKGYLSEYKDWSQIEQRAMEFAKGRILTWAVEPADTLCIFRTRGLT